jgi:hypothetical protein
MKIKSFTLLALISCTPIFGGFKKFFECFRPNNSEKNITSPPIKKFFSFDTKDPKKIKITPITRKNTNLTIEKDPTVTVDKFLREASPNSSEEEKVIKNSRKLQQLIVSGKNLDPKKPTSEEPKLPFNSSESEINSIIEKN